MVKEHMFFKFCRSSNKNNLPSVFLRPQTCWKAFADRRGPDPFAVLELAPWV